MALLHRASITPTKAELLQAWVPRQPWYTGSGPLTTLGAYRFDDPAGDVGIETFLVRAGDGPVLQVPLTYRAAPLDGGDAALVTEMEHSVLGPRWVYDGPSDPVYATALVTTVLTGGCQADLQVEVDGALITRETTTFARGNGGPGVVVPPLDGLARREAHECTLLERDGVGVTLCRVVGPTPAFDVTGVYSLLGRWPDRSEPTVLAVVRLG